MSILKKIEKKTGIKDIIEILINSLSGSEINSMLLKLFQKRTFKITPASVLEEFNSNRFCIPSRLDPIFFKNEEIKWLQSAGETGFKPLLLSPLTPLGTCSSVALVDQNNIVSASRGTEIISDATNVLALKAASDIKKRNEYNKYCTTHRHVRGQYFTNPNFSAHFGLFCMATPGIDEGSFKFETEQLEEHLKYYLGMLIKDFSTTDILLKVFIRDNNTTFILKLEKILTEIKKRTGIKIEKENKRNDYYETIQFKYFIKHKGEYLDVADGGFVNWTQKLLSNKKQRLLISGAGLELIIKIVQGMI